MKKIATTSLICIMASLITSCSSATKYPYEHIGIYDTKTKQYIDIGDSKESVDKRLGYGSKDGDTSYYDYDDILSIRFDDDCNVEHIKIWFDWFPEEGQNERYTLADGTDYNTTITEFIDKYKHVYEGAPIAIGNAVSVILQNKNGEIVSPDLGSIKKNIKSEKAIEKFHDDMYVISIEYAAYDSLYSFNIEKVDPDFIEWENFKEIE